MTGLMQEAATVMWLRCCAYASPSRLPYTYTSSCCVPCVISCCLHAAAATAPAAAMIWLCCCVYFGPSRLRTHLPAACRQLLHLHHPAALLGLLLCSAAACTVAKHEATRISRKHQCRYSADNRRKVVQQNIHTSTPRRQCEQVLGCSLGCSKNVIICRGRVTWLSCSVFLLCHSAAAPRIHSTLSVDKRPRTC
jgi:hypothetical protein